MASIVDICNKALSILGQKNIISINDNSPEALACRIHIMPLIEEILSKHNWNCVIKRALLNRLVDKPPFGYQYKFQLPGDCLRVVEVIPEAYYEVEGRELLCDSTEVSIRYIRTTDDSTKFGPQLAATISQFLASEICYNITKSTSLTTSLYEIAKEKLSDAKASDAFEGKTRDKRPGRWIAAKYR